MSVEFLTLDEVLALHADQLERYGGRAGLRDVSLLQSALAVPAATFGGVFLHQTIDEMAAAYLFHLARDHPFVDGNKRTALMAMLVFLRLNGFRLRAGPAAVFDLVVGVASDGITKAEASVFVKTHRRGIIRA